MAIDPTIALDTTVPQSPFGISQAIQAIGTLQNVRQSQQQVQNMQAQTPGIQAESDILQRAAQAQQWLQSNAKNYVTTSSDGTKTLDSQKMGVDMAEAGFPDAASSVYAHYLTNASNSIKNASDAYNLARGIQGDTATLLSAFPAGPEQDQHAAQQMQFYNNLGIKMPGTGIQLGNALTSNYVLKNPDGTPVMSTATDAQGNPIPKVDPVAVSAYKAATISPQSQETMASAEMAAGNDPESRDPNSPKSQQAVKDAQAAGFPGVHPGMSYTQLLNTPGYQDFAKNNIVPAATRSQWALNGSGEQAATIPYTNGIAAVNALAQRYPDFAQASTIGNWLSAHKDIALNSPEYRTVQAALAQIQKDNPAVDPLTVSPNALVSQMQTLSKNHSDAATAFFNLANNPTYNPTTPPSVLPPARSGGVVLPPMGNSNSTTITPSATTPTIAPTQTTAVRPVSQPTVQAAPIAPAPQAAPANTPKASNGLPPGAKQAPQAALDMLKANPALAPQFKAKYGYLPQEQ